MSVMQSLTESTRRVRFFRLRLRENCCYPKSTKPADLDELSTRDIRLTRATECNAANRLDRISKGEPNTVTLSDT